MWQLLMGAKKMHECYIVHRDIKPENILVADDHTVVKICDFGLAMSMSAQRQYEPTGTLWYKAPEMLLEKPDYDGLLETWSLGYVMTELINGRALFHWPFATEVRPELDVQRHNLLRELFPEEMLSKEGFEVLNGLLMCNPGKRLTAATALKKSWFSKIDALALPKKEVMASALPKRRRLL
ncbi:putative cyclin-dependent kinase F-2 [Phragmites australis]|uniref:putative cyclin-dependent kinase F-2 n=1 Tax=Phragmites australis TaxID=29695 RepID=UPI002D799BCC|nr:putative cyclin-dependent kinase F-2 [Phragmites australis]